MFGFQPKFVLDNFVFTESKMLHMK